MKAITQYRYGGLATLEFETVARPVAAKDEVLIRVLGASINAADWLLMQGEPFVARLAFGLRRPKVGARGRDVAGVIEAVGDNVRRFSVGDEVYAEVDAGSFAEYTVAHAKRLAHKPSRISFDQAAAMPTAATTALQGVRDAAKIKPGDKVLINGASGGVGSFAVQLAKAFGAEVTGVCSTANLEFVRSLGADHVID
ncbi:MAG: NAD(P)-dependent alcohol dehydrogenase, partial [Cryobacterium sp.]|nr:NAD(P)-dependent alcohol dehydrogenase [Cryobacterium sp.]